MYYVTITQSSYTRIFKHYLTVHTTHYIFDCPFEAAKFYEDVYISKVIPTTKSYGYDEILKQNQ